jgi:hypothetical protein
MCPCHYVPWKLELWAKGGVFVLHMLQLTKSLPCRPFLQHLVHQEIWNEAIITIKKKNIWPKHLKPIVKLGNVNQVQETQECWQSSRNWWSKMNLWIKHITWRREKNKVEQKTNKKNAKFTWTCKTPPCLCITWKHYCKSKEIWLFGQIQQLHCITLML